MVYTDSYQVKDKLLIGNFQSNVRLPRVNVIFDKRSLRHHLKHQKEISRRSKGIQKEKNTQRVHSGKPQVLTHSARIDILALHLIHHIPINKIAIRQKHHYSTVSKIVEGFQRQGHTSLLPQNQISEHSLRTQDDEILDLGHL